MNKKEVLELKRRLKKDQATFSRLVGCYVDCNHEKVCKFGGKFLTLEEDEYYKYLEISNKVLSGAGVELVTMDSREYILKKALEPVRKEYDYIFIDCPPSQETADNL